MRVGLAACRAGGLRGRCDCEGRDVRPETGPWSRRRGRRSRNARCGIPRFPCKSSGLLAGLRGEAVAFRCLTWRVDAHARLSTVMRRTVHPPGAGTASSGGRPARGGAGRRCLGRARCGRGAGRTPARALDPWRRWRRRGRLTASGTPAAGRSAGARVGAAVATIAFERPSRRPNARAALTSATNRAALVRRDRHRS